MKNIQLLYSFVNKWIKDPQNSNLLKQKELDFLVFPDVFSLELVHHTNGNEIDRFSGFVRPNPDLKGIQVKNIISAIKQLLGFYENPLKITQLLQQRTIKKFHFIAINKIDSFKLFDKDTHKIETKHKMCYSIEFNPPWSETEYE